MFGSLGLAEIVIIAGFALVAIGPEKFLLFAKAVMGTLQEIRTQFEEAQRGITKELQPLRKELNELRWHTPEKSPAALLHRLKFAIVGIAVAFAIFTPLDPISMIIMMIPLYLLYEAITWVSYLVVRHRKTAA